MTTLAQGQWLNNEVVNFVGRILIAPRRGRTGCRAHVYSSYFMSKLLSGGTQRRDYNFQEVRNFDNRIEGGLAGLDELYIPINVNNVHWIFIQVDFKAKTIHLYDSLGKQQSNDHYLEETLRYIYDATYKDSPQNKPTLDDWRQDWSTSDKSDRSPRQDNGYDCGMFMLISMGLLRNGHNLSRDSYRQSTLRLRSSRRKLAWTIWKAGLGDEEIRWQPQAQTPATRAQADHDSPNRGAARTHRRKRGRSAGGAGQGRWPQDPILSQNGQA